MLIHNKPWVSTMCPSKFHSKHSVRFYELLGERPDLSSWYEAGKEYLWDAFKVKGGNTFGWRDVSMSLEEISHVVYDTTFQFARVRMSFG